MQFVQLKRRVFISLLGGAVAWPSVARAQQDERMRRIGVLMGSDEHDPESQTRISALQRGLEALGWSEGRNIRIDYRFGGGDPERIDRYVAELVSIEPDLIVANSSPVLAALKRATGTIPIVFAAVVDPVGQGFVASLAHPGGNITGFTLIEFEIIGKWLELLKEMAPRTRRTTLLLNPMMAAPFNALVLRWLQVAPNTLATEFAAAPVQDKGAIEAAIAAVAREPGGGLIAGLDVFTLTQHALIVSLAERYRVPAIYASRGFAIDGGLMVYRPDTTDIFRRSASYVDRILKGAKPADLPIQQPTKFEMIISLRAAKALGLDVPLQLQQLADDVIE